jgi:hypothetical protein
MRTEAILVFALVVATPAYASKSCMTMAEARQQFATSHLYWHGSGHCWDATPPLHRVVRVKPRADQQARRDYPEEPKWRNAMSEMLPGDAPAEAASAVVLIAPDGLPRLDWLDRWVDVAQVASPALFDQADTTAGAPAVGVLTVGPAITPVRLFLLLLVVTLAAIGLLLRGLIHRRPR